LEGVKVKRLGWKKRGRFPCARVYWEKRGVHDHFLNVNGMAGVGAWQRLFGRGKKLSENGREKKKREGGGIEGEKQGENGQPGDQE